MAALSAIHSLNDTFKNVYDTTFTEILPKLSGVNLTPRKSKIEKKKVLRTSHIKIKKSIENNFQEDNKDAEALFGTRMSGSCHNKQRSFMYLKQKGN